MADEMLILFPRNDLGTRPEEDNKSTAITGIKAPIFTAILLRVKLDEYSM